MEAKVLHRWDVIARITLSRLVAVIRSDSAAEATHRGQVLVESGVDIIEVAFTTPNAPDAIRSLVHRHPNALIGAGTVLDEPTARTAILSGAKFLISPSLSIPVIQTGHRYGVATIPGVQTPTEMVAAFEAGADALKLFPAFIFGPEYLKATLAALPQIAVIPTGGVSADDARAWLDAGAVAVGVGGALTGGPIEETRQQARKLLQIVADAAENP